MNEPKTVQDSSTGNPAVQTKDAANGVPIVQEGPRQKIQRHRKGASKATETASAAIVPSKQKLTRRSQPSASVGREVPRFYEGLPAAIAVRDAQLTAEYANEEITTNLPPEVADFLDEWLRRNHLMFCAVDQEFWQAFAHVLTSIEGFSVEAVEEALKICLAGARSVSRRNAVYSELRSVRELRKVRNLSMKLQTSKLLVDRYLVRESDMVKGDFESNHPGTFTTPFKVGDKVVHEDYVEPTTKLPAIGVVTEITDDGDLSADFLDQSVTEPVSEWRHVTQDEANRFDARATEAAAAAAEAARLRSLPDKVYYLVAVDSAIAATEDKSFATLAEAQEFARDPKNRSMFIEKHVVHGDRTCEVTTVEHTRRDR